MPTSTGSIFNQKASDRLQSPDDLEKYVRVTTPSVWLVLSAILALVLGLFAWAVFGSVSTTVTAVGTCIDGQVVCFLDPEQCENVAVGNPAYIDMRDGAVASISRMPYSKSEANKYLSSDYLAAALMPGDWGYLVTFDDITPDEGEFDTLFTLVIVTERVSPISLVLR